MILDELQKQLDAFAKHYARGVEECKLREKILGVDGKPLGSPVATARCTGKYEAYDEVARLLVNLIEEHQGDAPVEKV